MRVPEMRALAADAPVARLATVRSDGSPHLVPCVFALDEETAFTPVDRKPKRSTKLQRLRNIERQPAVSLLVDRYEDDWDELWWVRMDGRAHIVSDPVTEQRALELLVAKYEQYRADPPDDVIIAVEIERWTGWSARG